MTEAETTVSDTDKTVKAARGARLLRSHVPQPKEHTIRMDGESGKGLTMAGSWRWLTLLCLLGLGCAGPAKTGDDLEE